MSPICFFLLVFLSVKTEVINETSDNHVTENLKTSDGEISNAEDGKYVSNINDTYFHNATLPSDQRNTKEELSTFSLIFKFISLIFGGLIVFTLVYLLMQCCHDNTHVSFARVRSNPPVASDFFMDSFQSKANLIPNEKLVKYALPYSDSFEYIDIEPLNKNDIPIMSPLSKYDN